MSPRAHGGTSPALSLLRVLLGALARLREVLSQPGAVGPQDSEFMFGHTNSFGIGSLSGLDSLAQIRARLWTGRTRWHRPSTCAVCSGHAIPATGPGHR